MRAMVLRKTGSMDQYPEPLELVELPKPAPAPGEVLIRVSVCGVCHTELDEIEGGSFGVLCSSIVSDLFFLASSDLWRGGCCGGRSPWYGTLFCFRKNPFFGDFGAVSLDGLGDWLLNVLLGLRR